MTQISLGELSIGDSFTMIDKGFGTGRVDTYHGIVIGNTTERLTAVRYGKNCIKSDGSTFVNDGDTKPRVGLWDSLQPVVRIKKITRGG
jgi:hypothetical protein